LRVLYPGFSKQLLDGAAVMELRMRTRMFAVLVAGAALSDAAGGGSDCSSPSVTNVQGTYIGSYTGTIQPGVVYQGVLQLTQNGNAVTGTLTTNAGRSASVSGSVSAGRITATFTYTDSCKGTASSTADIGSGGSTLVGNYTTTDCLGQYSGGYSLTKQ